MTSLECCNCGCQDSARWVCGSCNTNSQYLHSIQKTPQPTTSIQQSNTLDINHLSSIRKDILNPTTPFKHQQTHILSTSQKQQHFGSIESVLPLGSEGILCQQHNQPITFFHQEKHQLFCALCLFDSSISKQIIKPYGLVPIKASTDLVMKEFKSMMEQITELSRYLDEYLRRSIQYQRIIQKQRKYLSNVVSSVTEEMIRIVKQREEEMMESINDRLQQQMKIYQLHENHLSQLKNNIKSLRSLGGRRMSPMSIKTQELVYLFEAAKSIKKSLTRDTFKVEDFNVQQYNIKGFMNQKDHYAKTVSGVLSWIDKKQKRGRSASRATTRRQRNSQNGGYLENSKRGFK